MSAIGIDTGLDLAATRGGPDEICAAAREPARLLLCVAAGDPAVARRLLRNLRPVLYRLYRAGPQPQRPADHHHAGLFRLFRHRRLRRGDLCRIVRRHLLPGLSRRPVRTARDLHLCAARLFRGLGGDGVPDHVRRRAAVAVHRRDRHRRRDHHHRRLYHRAGAELDAGPRLRGQSGGDVHRGPDRGVSRLVAGAAVALRASMAGAGWC